MSSNFSIDKKKYSRPSSSPVRFSLVVAETERKYLSGYVLRRCFIIVPNMSVALITTLYGSLLANWIAGPTAEKLKDNNSHEIALKEVIVEGILSIQAGENPRIIEEKLKTFLSPAKREGVGSSEGGGGEN